jgi:hypothetical protein
VDEYPTGPHLVSYLLSDPGQYYVDGHRDQNHLNLTHQRPIASAVHNWRKLDKDLAVARSRCPNGRRIDADMCVTLTEPSGGVGMGDGIELADMIYRLRSELSRAMWSGEHADLKFKAESVELELTVGLEKSTDPKIAVRFWVLDMSAGQQQSSTVTQKITLRLHPVPAGTPEQDALIHGPAMIHED